MGKYKSASDSLKPGQLDRLCDKLKDTPPEVGESCLVAGSNSLLSDYIKLRKAAECIRHWHDKHEDGRIVSGEKVRELWKVLSEIAEL